MARFWNRIVDTFTNDIGIDLGTANTVVCTKREGMLLCEPSVVAVKKGTSEVLMNGEAVGNAAKQMLDKVPGNIEAIRPLKSGVISDEVIAEAMLSYFIRKVSRRQFVRPRVVISVPMGITSLEKKAVRDASELAGAREVYLIDQPMAAALGAGLPINDPSGSMVVDIGGGTTDIAVISLSGVVEYQTLRVAGDNLNQAIADYMKEHYGLLVGEQTSERIKIALGSVVPLRMLDQQEMKLEVSGRSTTTHLPARVQVDSVEIRECLQPVAMQIIESIKDVLRKTPPELSADLVDKGLVLCGGGAYLRGLAMLITSQIGIPSRVDAEPLYAVARGTAAVTKRFENLEDVLVNAAEID